MMYHINIRNNQATNVRMFLMCGLHFLLGHLAHLGSSYPFTQLYKFRPRPRPQVSIRTSKCYYGCFLSTFPSSENGMYISYAAEELGFGPWRWRMVLWIRINNLWHLYLLNNDKYWCGAFTLQRERGRGLYKECGSKLSSQEMPSFRIYEKERMTLGGLHVARRVSTSSILFAFSQCASFHESFFFFSFVFW